MQETLAPARSQKIFLIDDDDDLRFTIAMSLRDGALEVEEFGSADEALSAVLASPPGAIFLDYRIVGMSAPDFVSTLRTRGFGGVPVILLTGSQNIAELAAEMGVFDALAKPFDIDDLVARGRAAVAFGR